MESIRKKAHWRNRKLLSDLQQSLGYGGMIHSFKNYVLRGDKKYFDKAIKQSDVISHDILLYTALSPSKN